MLLLRSDGWQSLSQVAPRLGESPEADFEQFGCELQPGEVLVIFTEGVRDAADAQGCPLGEAGVAEALLGRLDRPAEELVAAVRSRLEELRPGRPRAATAPSWWSSGRQLLDAGAWSAKLTSRGLSPLPARGGGPSSAGMAELADALG